MKIDRLWLKAFTLIELLVAVSVLTILLVILLGMTQNVSTLWQRAEGQKNRQQTARMAMAAITKDLESSLFSFSTNADPRLEWRLNPGFNEFQNPNAAFWAATAPAGEDGTDVAQVGYFVVWTTNDSRQTAELRRLFIPGIDPDSIFQDPSQTLDAATVARLAPGSEDTNSQRGLIGQNIAGLWIKLFKSDGTALPTNYDSITDTNRPAFAEVAILVLDPTTAKRLNSSNDVTKHYGDDPDDADDAALKLQQDQGITAQVFRQRVALRAAPLPTPAP